MEDCDWKEGFKKATLSPLKGRCARSLFGSMRCYQPCRQRSPLPMKPNVASIPSCVHVAIYIKANRTIRQRAPKNVRDVKSSFSATERVGAPGSRVIVAEIELGRKGFSLDQQSLK